MCVRERERERERERDRERERERATWTNYQMIRNGFLFHALYIPLVLTSNLVEPVRENISNLTLV